MQNLKIPAYRQAGKCQMKSKSQMSKRNLRTNLITLSFGSHLTGKCPDKPCFFGGFKGHNMKETSLPGSVALGRKASNLNFDICHLHF
jgi:hypothetical protein